MIGATFNRGLAVGALLGVAAIQGCSVTGRQSAPTPAVDSAQVDAPNALHSWMDPGASSQDLLYVGTNGPIPEVYVFTYPQGEPAGALSLNQAVNGLCVDRSGDVFVVTVPDNSSGATIYEYSHAGTSPIQVLTDGGEGLGCSVDPESGNLAVGNAWDDSNPYGRDYGSVAIYPGARGAPTMYYNSNHEFGGFSFCGYDDSGDLYVSAFDEYNNGGLLVRMTSGSGSFQAIALDKTIPAGSSVQWDGKHMTLSSLSYAGRAPAYIYRLNIAGTEGRVIGTTTLLGGRERHEGETWIDRGRVIAVDGKSHANVSFWKYPKGGRPTQTIMRVADSLWGITVSPASSRNPRGSEHS